MPPNQSHTIFGFFHFPQQYSARFRTLLIATVLLGITGSEQILAQSPNNEIDPLDDPEAMLFVNSCLQCHRGVLNRTELIDTHNRPVQNLDAAVRRMIQYTGPLTEKQIADLVALMKDPDYIMRIEEAELIFEESIPISVVVEDVASSDDLTAKLYINKCASCHTIGGDGSSGGDLANTVRWQVPQLWSAVKRMELRVGPMSDEQVTSLVAFLKDNSARQRLAAAGLIMAGSIQPAAFASPTRREIPAEVRQRGLISVGGPPVGIIIAVLAVLAAALIAFAVYLGKKGSP